MDKISSNLKSIKQLSFKINDEKPNNRFKLKVYLSQF